jgi:ankyrin repeat protein
VIKELIKKGLDINSQSAKGTFRHTPLNIAVQQKLKEVFEILIDLGADVNVTVGNGNSVLSNALMWAQGDDYFIEKLIEYGANVYKKNDHGISPISLAYDISNYDYKQYFTNFDYSPS